jgi:hypothetical protein
VYLHPRLHAAQQHHSPGLRYGHGGRNVARKKQFFNRHDGGLGFGNYVGEFFVNSLQAHCVVFFDGRTYHAGVHQLHFAFVDLQHAKAQYTGARVDSHDSHTGSIECLEMKTPDFTFYNNADYFRQLAREVAATKPGDRVAVATMGFEPKDALVTELVQTLCVAASRGVKVLLSVDARTFLSDDTAVPGPLWLRPNQTQFTHEPYHGRLEGLEMLRKSGGTVAITNLPHRPFAQTSAGRSHIKGAVVNDKLYIGGCNLEDASYIDIMVGWHSPTAATWLHETIHEMVHKKDTHLVFQDNDQTCTIDGVDLLIDAGKRKQSVIFDTALQLIDKAEERVFYTGQFFPSSKTARHLRAAHARGVDVQIYYAHPSIHGFAQPAHEAVILYEKLRSPASFFAHQLPKDSPKLHAKVLASEKAAMVGSHNYISQGVTFGTAEIALHSKDPTFSHNIRTFMLDQIQKYAA